MTGTQILILVLLVVGIAAVIVSSLLSETALATKKEKQHMEEKKAEAKKEFDNYLEEQLKDIKERVEAFEKEMFDTLRKNAAHDIEVASNEAVEKIGNKTDEVKKQMEELFETAKKEIEALDSNYLTKLEESKIESEKKAEDILEKSMKDLELIKEEANNLVAGLEQSCFESADAAAKSAIDELDIITVFKEMYEKSDLHKKGDKSLHENKENVEAELIAEEDEKEAEEAALEEAVEETIAEIDNAVEAEADPEIAEIKDLAKQIENTDFEVSEEEIEKIKEKENLTNDKKADSILDLTETEELDKTKIIPQIGEEFEFVEEEFPKITPAEEIIEEDLTEVIPAEEVGKEEFSEVSPEEEVTEEESKLFKVMRENEVISPDIDEATVSEVLRMNKRKKTSMQIANELGIGIAEVRTIIDLFTD